MNGKNSPKESNQRRRLFGWLGLSLAALLLASIPFAPMPSAVAERALVASENGINEFSSWVGAAVDRALADRNTTPLPSAGLPEAAATVPALAPYPDTGSGSSYGTASGGSSFMPSSPEYPSDYGELNGEGRPKTQWVDGYTRSDGTEVQGYYRAPATY